MVSPYFFFKKLTTFFSHGPLESDDLSLAVVSSLLPFSHILYPVFFLNSATKKIILLGCHPPGGVTGRSAPTPLPLPSDPHGAVLSCLGQFCTANCAQTAISRLPFKIMTSPLHLGRPKKSNNLTAKRRFHAVTLTFDT